MRVTFSSGKVSSTDSASAPSSEYSFQSLSSTPSQLVNPASSSGAGSAVSSASSVISGSSVTSGVSSVSLSSLPPAISMMEVPPFLPLLSAVVFDACSAFSSYTFISRNMSFWYATKPITTAAVAMIPAIRNFFRPAGGLLPGSPIGGCGVGGLG